MHSITLVLFVHMGHQLHFLAFSVAHIFLIIMNKKKYTLIYLVTEFSYGIIPLQAFKDGGVRRSRCLVLPSGALQKVARKVLSGKKTSTIVFSTNIVTHIRFCIRFPLGKYTKVLKMTPGDPKSEKIECQGEQK